MEKIPRIDCVSVLLVANIRQIAAKGFEFFVVEVGSPFRIEALSLHVHLATCRSRA